MESTETPPLFRATPPQQAAIGLACGALTLLASQLVNLLHIPLFLDEFLMTAAAFFGWTAGLCCAAAHVLLGLAIGFCFNPEGFSFAPQDFLFCLCDVAQVAIIRLLVARTEKISAMELLLAGFLSAIASSILGGAVFTLLFTFFGYDEIAAVRHLTLILVRCRIPLAPAAMLSRLPVNLMDKVPSVFLGFAIARAVRRLLLAPRPRAL